MSKEGEWCLSRCRLCLSEANRGRGACDPGLALSVLEKVEAVSPLRAAEYVFSLCHPRCPQPAHSQGWGVNLSGLPTGLPSHAYKALRNDEHLDCRRQEEVLSPGSVAAAGASHSVLCRNCLCLAWGMTSAKTHDSAILLGNLRAHHVLVSFAPLSAITLQPLAYLPVHPAYSWQCPPCSSPPILELKQDRPNTTWTPMSSSEFLGALGMTGRQGGRVHVTRWRGQRAAGCTGNNSRAGQ